MLFTDCQKKISFKSYAQLKLWILVAILIDFRQKLRFSQTVSGATILSTILLFFWSTQGNIDVCAGEGNFKQTEVNISRIWPEKQLISRLVPALWEILKLLNRFVNVNGLITIMTLFVVTSATKRPVTWLLLSNHWLTSPWAICTAGTNDI